MSETEDAQSPTQSDVSETSIVKEDIEATSTTDNKECPEHDSHSPAMTHEAKDATEHRTTEETGEKSRDEVEANVNPIPVEDSVNVKETPLKTVATSERGGAKLENGNENKNGNENNDESPGVGKRTVDSGEDTGCPDNRNAAVGEWSSLPVLVERLRAALDLSIATNNRQNSAGEQLPENFHTVSEENLEPRKSLERKVPHEQDSDFKNDLKFLEDLLLSDIQSAFSRLRETLERIDVLATYGSTSESTSKLLLRLISSLLSRLERPPETVPEKKTLELPNVVAQSRKRRGTRHTVGVSAEELANARRWLEEEREKQALLSSRKIEEIGLGQTMNLTITGDKQSKEIHDKYTKDAINQRQSLRDKNKEVRGGNCADCGMTTQSTRMDFDDFGANQKPAVCRIPCQCASETYQNSVNSVAVNENNQNREEQSRVSQLVAALKQRAEAITSVNSYNGELSMSNNKFAKRGRMKRANSVDISSYLRLHERDHSSCISLRRPINVGDKIGANGINPIVPSFEPKTDNDRKFLALMNKNNDAVVCNPVTPFKTFGFPKPSTSTSQPNKTWNSRFSNIKTTFDKQGVNEVNDSKLPCKHNPINKFSSPFQVSVLQNVGKEKSTLVGPTSRKPLNPTPAETGFRHAPSSPFRKIEKQTTSPAQVKVPSVYHWPKSNTSALTVKEKAKAFFDRSNNINDQAKLKPNPYQVSNEKMNPGYRFWNEGTSNDGKPDGAVTESGRLDYRSFCKQFAPFVGKGVDLKYRETGEPQQQYMVQHNDSTSVDEPLNVVDGKISFKILPKGHAQPLDDVQEFPRRKFNVNHNVPTIQSPQVRHAYHGSKNLPKGDFGNKATRLHGTSSIGIQTGISDENPDDARSVVISSGSCKDQLKNYNSVCVQTGSDLTDSLQRPLNEPEVKIAPQPSSNIHPNPSHTVHPVYSSNDLYQPILDHNQNFRAISNDVHLSNSELALDKDSRSSKREQDPRTSYSADNSNIQNISEQLPHSKPKGTSSYDRSEVEELKSTRNQNMHWPLEEPDFLDGKNIQNQDISPEIGVVTRYTCAIATVASESNPEQQEIDALDSQTPSSPSPAHSWSRSRPPTNETSGSEDEIRRHNLLQQNLARRLQTERTSLSRQASPSHLSSSPIYTQEENYSQPPSSHPSPYPYSTNLLRPPNLPESGTINQNPKYLSPSIFRELDRTPGRVSPTVGCVPMNRVVTLRDAYEQPSNYQLKPIQKEKSPIPAGLSLIDSSDEYLVSCATKPSRSIVLSKSESWHQLAASNNYPRAARIHSPVNPSTSSAHTSCGPKPPKSKSPSSKKFRTKQFEASSSAEGMRKMEEKMRQYFDHPAETGESREHSKSKRTFHGSKNHFTLSRSRTMLGISGENLRLTIPEVQAPLLQVSTADVDKVFDDLFQEVTRNNDHQC